MEWYYIILLFIAVPFLIYFAGFLFTKGILKAINKHFKNQITNLKKKKNEQVQKD